MASISKQSQQLCQGGKHLPKSAGTSPASVPGAGPRPAQRWLLGAWITPRCQLVQRGYSSPPRCHLLYFFFKCSSGISEGWEMSRLWGLLTAQASPGTGRRWRVLFTSCFQKRKRPFGFAMRTQLSASRKIQTRSRQPKNLVSCHTAIHISSKIKVKNAQTAMLFQNKVKRFHYF